MRVIERMLLKYNNTIEEDKVFEAFEAVCKTADNGEEKIIRLKKKCEEKLCQMN